MTGGVCVKEAYTVLAETCPVAAGWRQHRWFNRDRRSRKKCFGCDRHRGESTSHTSRKLYQSGGAGQGGGAQRSWHWGNWWPTEDKETRRSRSNNWWTLVDFPSLLLDFASYSGRLVAAREPQWFIYSFIHSCLCYIPVLLICHCFIK